MAVSIPTEPEVHAAGGVVRRPAHDCHGTDGSRGWEIAVIHRPRYDDWSFPKGKRDGDETDEETALREVEEETGLRCGLDRSLGEVRYRDARGRDKSVQYWLMDLSDPDGTTNVPNREVDELRWCDPREARELLSYDHDRTLLDRVPEDRV
jgi:8-oxo-dGTP diphosphatase